MTQFKACLVLAWIGATGSGLGQEFPPTTAFTPDRSGATQETDPRFRILDDTGEPVAGATVRLIQQTQTYGELVDHQWLHETKTDQHGYFRLPDGRQVANAQMENSGISATWVTVPARHGEPERTWLIGTSAGAYSPYMESLFSMAAQPGALEKKRQEGLKNIPTTYMLPHWETTLRVRNHDGTPAIGVDVTPIRIVWLSKGATMFPITVPPRVRRSMRRTTDEDGKVTFTTIDRMEFAEVEFESPEHGIQRTFSNANSIGDQLHKDLILFPTGTVAGMIHVTNAGQREFLTARKLLFKSQVRNSGLRYPGSMSIPMHGYAEVTVDEHSRFEIPVMVNGRLTLYDRLEEGADTRIAFPSDAIVKPSQTTHVEGRVTSTVRVVGILRIRDTEEPVANAAISIRHGKQSGLARELIAYTQTDDKGRFEARVFPGMIGCSPLTVMPGHVPVYEWEQPKIAASRIPKVPYGRRIMVPDGLAEYALPPLELVPSMTLTGRLIGSDGKPISNMGVYAFPEDGRSNCDFAQTNTEGEFMMTQIPSTHPPTFFKAGKKYKTSPATIVSREPLVLRWALP